MVGRAGNFVRRNSGLSEQNRLARRGHSDKILVPMKPQETSLSREALSRRRFLGASSLAISSAANMAAPKARAATAGKPALLGGTPVKGEAFPGWPVFDSTDENAVADVVRSGHWGRSGSKKVLAFEQSFSQLMNAQACLATSSGTTALFVSLNALGIGPGDEVIVPPYTFVACVNVILACHALPVFVDTDPETFQLDARKLESVVTERTRAILPVHLGGSTFDVDAVQAFARKHNLFVIEDSCQSHLAEWRGKRTGSFGSAGCFSFQASKNLNSGEGGAILGPSQEFIEKCYTFHNNGRSRTQAGYDFSYANRGLNLRMTEFQGCLLTTQMARLETQSAKRTQNAQYLTGMLREVQGLTPVKMYEGCTRNAYHLYMMRYDSRKFGGLPRATFLKALDAEGIPASGGYFPLNKEPFLKNTFASSGFQAIYSQERLAKWEEANHTPANDQICAEAVWFTQNMLIGPKRDMDQIAGAVHKVQQHSAELIKA
jgi:perosamine synthetase